MDINLLQAITGKFLRRDFMKSNIQTQNVFQKLKMTFFKIEKKTRDFFSAKGADIYTRFVRRMFFFFILAGIAAITFSFIVILIASVAQPVVKVPSVVGMNVIEAAIELQDKGLVVEITSKFDTNSQKYTVLDQYPSKGSSVRKGRTVSLLVSMGKDVYTVPNLVGMNREEAENLLTKLNITYSITVIQSADYAINTVISQDIPPGKEVDREVRINLLVNSDVGEGQYRIGDYTKQPLEIVARTLLLNSVQPVIEGTPVSNPEEDGLVVEQNILSNTVVPKNSEIRLRVGIYEENNQKRQIARYLVFSYKLESLTSISPGESSSNENLSQKTADVKIILSDEANEQREILNKPVKYGDWIVVCFKAYGKAKLSLFVDNNFIKEIPYE